MRRYVEVWRLSGARTLIVLGVMGRIPAAVLPLALLLLVKDQYGSFALGGLALAAYGLSFAVSSPVQGRLADRLDACRVLMVAGVVFPIAIAFLGIAIWAHVTPPLLIGSVVLAGLSQPILAAAARSSWPLVAPAALRAAAYSLDAVLSEIIWTAGPMIVAVSVALGSPYLPLIVVAVVAAGLSLTLGRATVLRHQNADADADADADAEAKRSFAGPLLLPGVARTLLTAGAFAFGIGVFEVVVAAYADAKGSAIANGLVLAAWSIGSMLGGLAYGAMSFRSSLWARYRWAMLATALSLIPMIFDIGLMWMSVVAFISGVVLGPLVALHSQLLARLVPIHMTTEAFTWSTTLIFAGSAVGSAFAGALVDSTDLIGLAMVLAVGVLLLGTMLSVVRLRRGPARPAATDTIVTVTLPLSLAHAA